MATPTEDAAQILTRIFESLARVNGKTLSAKTRADIGRACELLASQGDELDAMLDDLAPAPRRSPGESAIDNDPGFQQWRASRAYDER